MHSSEASSFFQQSMVGCKSYDGKIAGLYDLEETLGSGHFAVVKLARHVFTGAKVAVKVVDKTKLDAVSKAHLFQEVRCMKLVQHPNVVRLYEVIDTQTKLYLVLEFGDGGDLYDYIMRHDGGLSEELAQKYFRQILRAISYCHQLHVVHRDLKPENVVFFEKIGIVKLTDFGFSNKFSPGQKLETFCGSLAYSAPEILLGDSYDAPAVDIWSLGVILYMLVCGQPPFEKANDSETLTMIMDCKYNVPSQVSQNCRKLIASMLVRDPQKRASLEEIAADPWLKQNSELDLHEYSPLVSRQQLSDEDHAFIIQKMINGKIATKEEILQSLDKNNYNHITATFFLLAEIRLRKHIDKKKKKLPVRSIDNTDSSLKNSSQENEQKPDEGCRVLLTSTYIADIPDKRNRKCSIVREENEDEIVDDNSANNSTLQIAITRRESISEGRINRSVEECTNKLSPVLLKPGTEKIFCGPKSEKFTKINSQTTLEILNKNLQITKTDRAASVSKKLQPNPIIDLAETLEHLEIGHSKTFAVNSKNAALTQRRIRLDKNRTPSCSSSEASDDDTKIRNKKKLNKLVGDTPSRFHKYRRDSHDDSSDQDQTCPDSQTHTMTHLTPSSKTSVEEKGDSDKQNRENSKSNEKRKSSNLNSHKYQEQSKEQFENHSHLGGQQLFLKCRRNRRNRESSSLDRITECQECDLRHRYSNYFLENQIDYRKPTLKSYSYTVIETNEEYAMGSNLLKIKTGQYKSESNKIENSFNAICKIKNIYHYSLSRNTLSIRKIKVY